MKASHGLFRPTLAAGPIFFAFSLLVIPQANGESSRANSKAASRWSLDEWLKQKERNRWMDQWLALHTSESNEFFISADLVSRSLEVRPKESDPFAKTIDQSVHVQAGAYASIVGLEAEYESLRETQSSAFEGAFHLRLFGTSNQSSNLTLHYGLRYRAEPTEKIRSQVPGATLCLYLLKHFGVEGSYRLELPEDSDQGSRWQGNRVEGEVFIDYEALRVFGRYSREHNEVHRSQSPDTETLINEGLGGGVKIFF